MKTDSQISKKTGNFDEGPLAASGRASENNAVELNPSDMKKSDGTPDLRRSMSEFD